MRVVVSLLDERKFFSLRLIESSLDTVGFLQLFESENEEFRVVLVRKRRERNRSELPRFEPVNGSRVDRDSLFRRNVRSILEVRVLPLLFSLEVETSETTQVLLGDSFLREEKQQRRLAVELERGERGMNSRRR